MKGNKNIYGLKYNFLIIIVIIGVLIAGNMFITSKQKHYITKDIEISLKDSFNVKEAKMIEKYAIRLDSLSIIIRNLNSSISLYRDTLKDYESELSNYAEQIISLKDSTLIKEKYGKRNCSYWYVSVRTSKMRSYSAYKINKPYFDLGEIYKHIRKELDLKKEDFAMIVYSKQITQQSYLRYHNEVEFDD